MLRKPVYLISISFIFFLLTPIPKAKGADLDYQFVMQGDGSGRPHITLQISNIGSDTLNLVVNSPLVDDYGNYYPDLINMIQNVSVKDKDGSTLDYSFSQETITSSNWFWFLPIYHDVYTINTYGNDKITVEYDVASNIEIYTGLGAREDAFWGTAGIIDFWSGYLEFILFRPDSHRDVSAAKIYFSLPSNWNYEIATFGTRIDDEVNLGTLAGMYGDNIRWKNYQRSTLVIYNKSKFNMKSKNIKGIRVADVYSSNLEGSRNQKAFFQYFDYLCDKIGTLPITSHLTFYPAIDGNQIPYLRAYQSGPNGYGHGLMGEFYGCGGDIGLGDGSSLNQVQLWAFNGFDNGRSYSFPMHGTVRPWIFLFIQFAWADLPRFKGGFCTYYENMCVAQKYGLDNIIERRFKPMYKYYVDNIAGPPEIDEKNFTNHSFIEYFKSCLTAYYIDLLLKESSGGAKTLHDLMKLLFQKAEQGILINREIFTEALNSLTRYDFTGVVDDYLYGSSKLPLDENLLPSTIFADIQANGSDGPVSVSSGTPISIRISLNPCSREGELADWWVATNTPFVPPGDWYTYVYPAGWRSGVNLCVQTELFELNSFEVLNMLLPAGDYTFYFALDDPDGEATGPWWAIDSVKVSVKQ